MSVIDSTPPPLATGADLDDLVEVLAVAFDDDPVVHWAFPDLESRARIIRRFFRFQAELALSYNGVYTSPGRDAVLMFLPPGAWDEVAARAPEVAPVLAEMAEDRAEAMLTIMQTLGEAHANHRPHYFVTFVGVHPSAQRTGTLTRLSQPLLDRADAEGMPMYTEASSAGGLAVALKLGFEPHGPDIVLPNGPAFRPLWREPR